MNKSEQSFTPREIVSELDRFIVGQDDAKRAVAIALRNRWRRHPSGRSRGRFRKQLQRSGCDNTERTFCTHEQLFKVVARVVLAECAEAIPYLTIGQHDL